jgi:hypothetical protein
VKHMTEKEIIQLVHQLEPEVLNVKEHRELLRWALRHARLGLAAIIWRRMRRGYARL